MEVLILTTDGREGGVTGESVQITAENDKNKQLTLADNENSVLAGQEPARQDESLLTVFFFRGESSSSGCILGKKGCSQAMVARPWLAGGGSRLMVRP